MGLTRWPNRPRRRPPSPRLPSLRPPIAAPPPAPDTRPAPLALTISGGATLGVHEAGYLYLLTEALRRADDAPRLALATGASAGSVNTLLAVLGACQPAIDAPADSPGWALWVDNGLADLQDPGFSSPVSLFSQRALFEQRAVVAQAWAAGLDADCDVVVSLPVTRLRSVEVAVSDALAFPRQTQRFVVRVQGHGPGRPPTLQSVRDPASYGLPFTGDVDADLRLLWQVVVASAAFPGAFAPVTIGYCEPLADTCDAPTASAAFIDGGVFDNVPLRMAHRLTADLPQVRHVYLDPAIRSYPEPSHAAPAGSDLSLGSFLADFASGFVAQARTHELFALAEQDPDVFHQTEVALSRAPQAGAHLQNFFGMFDRDLRAFDHALGMFDAWSDLARVTGLAEPPPALAARWDDPSWTAPACVRGWYERDPALQARCSGPEWHDLRVLIAVSLARVYSTCQGLSPALPAVRAHPHCAAAADGALPPTVVAGLGDPADALKRPGEDDLTHALRLMAAFGYAWDDLGLRAEDARRAPGVMADHLDTSLRGLARAQDDPIRRRLVLVAGRQGIGAVLEPPSDPARVYLLSGTVAEIGGSVQPLRGVEGARLHAAVQGDGLISVFTRDAEELSVSPAVGVEIDPWPRPSKAVSAVFGGRMAWQLGTPDGVGTRSCPTTTDPRLCSQPVAQAYTAATIARLLRVQLELDLHPWLPHAGTRYDVQIAVGPEF